MVAPAGELELSTAQNAALAGRISARRVPGGYPSEKVSHAPGSPDSNPVLSQR